MAAMLIAATLLYEVLRRTPEARFQPCRHAPTGRGFSAWEHLFL